MVLDSSSAPPPLVPCGVRAPTDLRLLCVLLTGHHLADGILRYECAWQGDTPRWEPSPAVLFVVLRVTGALLASLYRFIKTEWKYH